MTITMFRMEATPEKGGICEFKTADGGHYGVKAHGCNEMAITALCQWFSKTCRRIKEREKATDA